MVTNQRSRTAILSGAKKVIAQVGSYESNMLDIAEQAQVSRATVYNHFSDKEEMLMTLVESEILRLSALAKKSENPAEALYLLSREISIDPALRRMVETDPLDIAKFVTISDHPLWQLAIEKTKEFFTTENYSLVIHWLIGQIASPLTESQSRHQSHQLSRALM